MDIVNGLRNSPILNACSSIQEICNPLKKYNIDFFVYGKTFPDKKRIFLSTHAEWNKEYITNVYNLNYIENYIFEENIQCNHLFSAEMFPKNVAFKQAKDKYNLCYGFAMPFLNGSSREVCYFATTKYAPHMFNFFMQNIDNLTNFKCFFKEQAVDLIKDAEKNKLPGMAEYLKNNSTINEQCLLPLPAEVRQQLLKEIKSNRYYLINDPKERYLTKSEYNCAIWLINGKSAEEIGIITGLSRRTVEAYTNHMKDKFDCSKTTHLVYKLISLGLTVDR